MLLGASGLTARSILATSMLLIAAGEACSDSPVCLSQADLPVGLVPGTAVNGRPVLHGNGPGRRFEGVDKAVVVRVESNPRTEDRKRRNSEGFLLASCY